VGVTASEQWRSRRGPGLLPRSQIWCVFLYTQRGNWR
jgi:hypothetical protein